MFAGIALAAVLSFPQDGWIRFEQPAVDGTERLGCAADGTARLDARNWNIWSSDEDGTSRPASRFEKIALYVRFEDGAARQVRAFTPDCRIENAEQARPMTLDPAQGVALLEGILQAGPAREPGSLAMAALAHIDAAGVTDTMAGYAADLDHEQRSHDALFWLAVRRGERGRAIVTEHLDARWPVKHREQAVMTLALSEHPQALATVREIARNAPEPELRARAVAALGIVQAPGALADLHSVFIADDNPEVRRQAIFGIAQLDSAAAAETLARIVRNPRYAEQRRDALFWLAGMDGQGVQPVIDDLIDDIFPEKAGD